MNSTRVSEFSPSHGTSTSGGGSASRDENPDADRVRGRRRPGFVDGKRSDLGGTRDGRGAGGGGRPRPDGPPHPGAEISADHRARCPGCEGPAAIRGEGAGRRPERTHRADRRHGVWPVERLRRADPHAHGRAAGRQRAPLQPVPHDGALLADPGRAALRPQPSHVQHGLDHGDGDRLPRPDRAAAQQRGPAGRDAAPQWLRHRRLRQVARDGGLGGQHFGPDQSLADPIRLRQVLRLHRRRGQSVGTVAVRWDESDRAAERLRTIIS